MNILSSFFADDLAIDLGTVNTVIYTPEQGVVLNEPSILAIHKHSREILSVGAPALKLLGREPNDTEVHRPIRRGAIDNFEISQQFLRALISRVQHHDHPKRSHLVIGVPGSSTPLERRSVKDAARDAKAGRVDLIDEGLAAALGAGLDFDNEQARLIEDASPEVTADIYYSGLILTGGGALLHGMSTRLQSDLNLRVTIPEDPLITVALGAGRLLSEPERLQRASLRLDAPAWEQAEKLVVNW